MRAEGKQSPLFPKGPEINKFFLNNIKFLWAKTYDWHNAHEKNKYDKIRLRQEPKFACYYQQP